GLVARTLCFGIRGLEKSFDGYSNTVNERERLRELSALADQVAATTWAHAGRVNLTGRDITAVASVISGAPGGRGQDHFALEHDVRRFHCMGVVRIMRTRGVLPDIGMAEALAAKLFGKGLLVHLCIVRESSGVHATRSVQTRLRPFRTDGGRCGKGAP